MSTASQPAPGEPKLAVALSGGGVRGAAHFGVLHALELEGIEVAAIAGASSGAIVGMLYALGKFSRSKLEIHRLMSAIGAERYDDLQHLFFKDHSKEGLRDRLRTLSNFERALRSAFRTPGVAKLEPLRETLEGMVGAAHFADARIPFAMTATDLLSGEKVVLREGRLLEAALASSAIPGVFPPVELGGRLLADGHIVDNVPVDVARSMLEGAPGLVLAVDLAFEYPLSAPRTAFDVILRAAQISRDHLRTASLGKADIVLHVGEEVPAHVFEHARARDLFEAGLQKGLEVAPQIKRALEDLRPKTPVPAAAEKPERRTQRGIDWRAIFQRARPNDSIEA